MASSQSGINYEALGYGLGTVVVILIILLCLGLKFRKKIRKIFNKTQVSDPENPIKPELDVMEPENPKPENPKPEELKPEKPKPKKPKKPQLNGQSSVRALISHFENVSRIIKHKAFCEKFATEANILLKSIVSYQTILGFVIGLCYLYAGKQNDRNQSQSPIKFDKT